MGNAAQGFRAVGSAPCWQGAISVVLKTLVSCDLDCAVERTGTALDREYVQVMQLKEPQGRNDGHSCMCRCYSCSIVALSSE